MARVVVAPATLVDLAEASAGLTRMQWGLVRELYAKGQFFAFRAGGELVAIAGFNPLGTDGQAELFFNPTPAARRHMPGIIHTGRLTILAAPYRDIVTVCISDAGKLFAKRLGFAFAAHSDLGEVWRHGGFAFGGIGESAEGCAAAAGGPDRVGAADQPGADRGGAGPA